MHDIHQILSVRATAQTAATPAIATPLPAARWAAARVALSALALSSLLSAEMWFAAPAFAAEPAAAAKAEPVGAAKKAEPAAAAKAEPVGAAKKAEPAAAAKAQPAPAAKAQPAAAKKPKLPTLPCPAHVPEAVNPPAEATLELALPASGVQIYACTSGKPGEAPAWTPEGPHAVLNAGNKVAATHFAGPSWQYLDGSLLKGAKLTAADAPDKSAVPWLLLSSTPTGEGVFSRITHIQRLETVGGKAPEAGCDVAHVGTKTLVPYKANYFFYRTVLAGEAPKQCRAPAPKPKK